MPDNEAVTPELNTENNGRTHRKVELIVYTTPAELRMIAGMLEERSETRVNWYHTRYSFRNEKTFKEQP